MKRKQITIFLDETEAIPIEAIRKRFNPRQYKLIKSHITLCREDEIEDLALTFPDQKVKSCIFEAQSLECNDCLHRRWEKCL